MRCLLRVRGEAMIRLMLDALGMHEHTSEAESQMACGDTRALPHREAGLEPQDMW
jgi:hypothetical protein